MKEIKMVEYGDIDLLYEYFCKIDYLDTERYFISPWENIVALSKRTLRRSFFQCDFVAYAIFKDGEIQNILVLRLPNIMQNISSVGVVFVSIDNWEFVNKALELVKKDFGYRRFTKIKINMLNIQKNEKIIELVKRCCFKKEIDVGMNDDNVFMMIFSRFIEECV